MQSSGLAGAAKFSSNQIDVAHRIFNREATPIIVLFFEKSDRENFYYQKKRISHLHVN